MTTSAVVLLEVMPLKILVLAFNVEVPVLSTAVTVV